MKYKNEFIVRIRRKVVAWEEITYIVYIPTEETAVKIASEEILYQNKLNENGIIKKSVHLDKQTYRRLSQEESWILDLKSSGIGEVPQGEKVVEILSVSKRRTEKIPLKSKDYLNYHIMNKIPKE